MDSARARNQAEVARQRFAPLLGKQGARQRQQLFAEAVGQQAVAADAHEAFGQHMQEEAAEEVDGIEGHHLLLAAVSIIAPGEADAIPVECGKAVVGDGLDSPLLASISCATSSRLRILGSFWRTLG